MQSDDMAELTSQLATEKNPLILFFFIFFFPWVNFYHFHELSWLFERSDSTKLAQGRGGDHWGQGKKEDAGDKKEEKEREKDRSF